MLSLIIRYSTFALLSAALCVNSAFAQTHVNDIAVEGLNKFSKETVLSYAGIEKNHSYSQEELNNAVLALYKTGLFMNISITMNNNVCKISVEESPTVYKIEF